MKACRAYSWPGNLRELEIFVKRYLMSGDKELAFEKSRADLDDRSSNAALTSPRGCERLHPSPGQSRVAVNGPDSLRSLVQSVKLEAEMNAIAAALEKTGWNRKAAARLLKISYRTLLYKIEQYQLRSTDTAVFPGNNGPNGSGRAD